MKSALLTIALALAAEPQTYRKVITPMSIEYRQTLMSRIETRHLLAIDRQGSRVNLVLPGGRTTGRETRDLYLTDDRKYVMVADAIKAMSTIPLEENGAKGAKLVSNDPQCADSSRTLIGSATVLGHTVYGYSIASVPSLKTTVWYAPGFDCRELRSQTKSVDANGVETDYIDKIATKVTVADPDPALFAIPPGYREMAPLQLNRELMELRAGRKLDERELEQLMTQTRVMDDNYRRGSLLPTLATPAPGR